MYLCFAIIMDYYDIAEKTKNHENCSPERVYVFGIEMDIKNEKETTKQQNNKL